MADPSLTIAKLGLGKLGITKLAFPPNDSRPTAGLGVGPRYAYTVDPNVIAFDPPDSTIQEVDLDVVKGDSSDTTFTWLTLRGNPVDLSAASVEMQVRTGPVVGQLLYTFSSEPFQLGDAVPWFQAITINGEDGQFVLSLSGTETDSLVLGAWFYSIYITTGSYTTQFATGEFNVVAV